MSGSGRLSTGEPTLDEMLGGGLPADRSFLLVGGPGTGKSTLAMQFLQEGLERGEQCLYVSTEQTVEELRDSFSSFSFDLEADGLGFLTVHAAPGQTIESEEPVTTIQSLGSDSEEDALFERQFDMPFTRQHLLEYLRPHGPCDRVVFDSISGLSVVADRQELFRRTVLDLIRFFGDEFGATTLFTAEDAPGGAKSSEELLRFTTHGVIELRRELVDEDPHRFLEVTKMRGVDHDRRTVEIEFVPGGLRAGPRRRSQPPALKTHRHRPVGIDGLDQLCGGGLVRGTGVLLEHDGRANLTALFTTLLTHALETDHAVTLVPTIGLRQSRVETLLDGDGGGSDVESLLDDDRLFVLDLVGAWDRSLPNVFAPEATTDAVTDMLSDVDGRSDRPAFSLLNADALVHTLGTAAAREVRYFSEAALLGEEDTLLHVLNPSTVPETASAFYSDVAEQVLETWIGDDGLQYISLRKSPCGFVGATSLVEYVEEPPYLRVQRPPRSRDNPFTCE
jgi:KaiC/GvpD/RAD55 family RecA-like ATPase